MDTPEEARAFAAAKFPEVVESVVNKLFELAGPAENVRMIDLGTGPASIPLMIARAKPSWRITAVDGAKAMIRIAQIGIKMAKMSDRVDVQLADAKATGLPAASFDIVFCNNMLHHMPDPLPLWREIKRLAAPGGLIFVRDLVRPPSEADAHRLVSESGIDQPNQEDHYASLLSAFVPEEIRQQLADTGLTTLKVDGVSERYMDIHGRVG
jgi:ubiquinone/menaquinone biosynthesis C-methylase UbiE